MSSSAKSSSPETTLSATVSIRAMRHAGPTRSLLLLVYPGAHEDLRREKLSEDLEVAFGPVIETTAIQFPLAEPILENINTEGFRWAFPLVAGGATARPSIHHPHRG